ncbi:MAG TPA: thermonuclease family protein, partial [Ignavibacteriaceae bacterium]
TFKNRREKYGRYLAEIWLEEKKGKFTNINDLLVTEGFAKYQKY